MRCACVCEFLVFLTIQSNAMHINFAHPGRRFSLAICMQPCATAGVIGASERRAKRSRPRRLTRRRAQATNRAKSLPFGSARTDAGDRDAAKQRKMTATCMCTIDIGRGPGRRAVVELWWA